MTPAQHHRLNDLERHLNAVQDLLRLFEEHLKSLDIKLLFVMRHARMVEIDPSGLIDPATNKPKMRVGTYEQFFAERGEEFARLLDDEIRELHETLDAEKQRLGGEAEPGVEAAGAGAEARDSAP